MFDLIITEEEKALGFDYVEVKTGYGTIAGDPEKKQIAAKYIGENLRLVKVEEGKFIRQELTKSDAENINHWSATTSSPFDFEHMQSFL